MASDDYPGRFDGQAGQVWYSDVRQVRGSQLQIGDWLDTLDHRGARMIYAVGVKPRDPGARYVAASGWYYDNAADDPGSDWERVRDDVLYDIVNPDSQVAPDGTPVSEVPLYDFTWADR